MNKAAGFSRFQLYIPSFLMKKKITGSPFLAGGVAKPTNESVQTEVIDVAELVLVVRYSG